MTKRWMCAAALCGMAAVVTSQDPKPTWKQVRAPHGGPANVKYSPLWFAFPVDGQKVEIAIHNGKVKVTQNGRRLPDTRLRKTPGFLRVLDARGEVAGELTWWKSGGNLTIRPRRTQVSLGISVKPLGGALARHLDMRPGTALRITGVSPGGAAEKAGVKVDDLILAIDGQKPVTNKLMGSLLRKKKPGAVIKLKLQRKGEQIERSVRASRKVNLSDQSERLDSLRKAVLELRNAGRNQQAKAMVRMKEAIERARGAAVARQRQADGADPLLVTKRLLEQAEAARAAGKLDQLKTKLDKNLARAEMDLAQRQAELAVKAKQLRKLNWLQVQEAQRLAGKVPVELRAKNNQQQFLLWANQRAAAGRNNQMAAGELRQIRQRLTKVEAMLRQLLAEKKGKRVDHK